jgi:hypothetical protein
MSSLGLLPHLLGVVILSLSLGIDSIDIFSAHSGIHLELLRIAEAMRLESPTLHNSCASVRVEVVRVVGLFALDHLNMVNFHLVFYHLSTLWLNCQLFLVHKVLEGCIDLFRRKLHFFHRNLVACLDVNYILFHADLCFIIIRRIMVILFQITELVLLHSIGCSIVAAVYFDHISLRVLLAGGALVFPQLLLNLCQLMKPRQGLFHIHLCWLCDFFLFFHLVLDQMLHVLFERKLASSRVICHQYCC